MRLRFRSAVLRPPVLALVDLHGPAPTRRAAFVAVSLLTTALLLLVAPPAFALGTQTFSSTFNGSGEAPSPLQGPVGAAVDNSGGANNSDLYVADREDNVVDRFNVSGHYLSQITGSETAHHSFSGPYGLAVDQSNGNLYVVDQGNNVVDEFKPSGEFVQEFTGAEVPGGFSGNMTGAAVDPTTGELYVGDYSYAVIDVFNASGRYLRQFHTNGNPQLIALDPNGNLFVANGSETVVYTAATGAINTAYGSGSGVLESGGALGISVDTSTEDIYVAAVSQIEQYSKEGELLATFGSGDVSAIYGIAVGEANQNVYTADRSNNDVEDFTPIIIPDVSTSAESNLMRTSVTLNGEVDPAGGGNVTGCYFEYGLEKGNYNIGSLPCLGPTDAEIGTPTDPIESPIKVHTDLSGLTPGTTYHYRLLATDAQGTREGSDQVFSTPPAVPDLETDPATEVTGSSATLNGSYTGEAGVETHYYFEWGESASYGQTSSMQSDSSAGTQGVHVSINELRSIALYHYRIVASNKYGTDYGMDQTFETTGAPRIISFSSTNVTATTAELIAKIDTDGLNTKYHFEYGTTTAYGHSAPNPEGVISSSEAEKTVSLSLTNLQAGATYHFRVLAQNEDGAVTSEDQSFSFYPPSCPNEHIRQQTGTAYLPDCRAYELVSPSNEGNLTPFPSVAPASEQATDPSRLAYTGAFGIIPGLGEPSNGVGDMYVATRTEEGWVTKFVGLPSTQAFLSGGPPEDASNEIYGPGLWEMGVVGNPSLSKIVNWSDGFPSGEYSGTCPCIGGSNAPYVWESTSGDLLGRFPTNLAAVPGGEEFSGQPYVSRDLSHFVFTSNLVFAEGGIPGDTFDNNTVTRSTKVASLSADGEDKQGSTVKISSEGSHILMSANGELYLRINDVATVELTPGHAVNFVGMTADGSEVYFTSEEHLTSEDPEHGGNSLYMWSEARELNHEDPITLISKGDNPGNKGEPGNTAMCNASWTSQCGAQPISFSSYSGLLGGLGGNCHYAPTCQPSDSFIASGNGDIYFYSPEQLDGPRGIPNQQDLYVYRNGRVQYVTTFTPGSSVCTGQNYGTFCSSGPIARMDVSPEDSHMAFITNSQISAYDNTAASGICSYSQENGSFGPKCSEMYSYNPSTGQLSCDSCNPNGAPPEGEVYGSQNGLFMTNDGRTFFSTTDALVSQDTNQNEDVYEYTEGRPQLITSGTSPGNETFGFVGAQTYPGLIGVSSNGTDVYFSTYEVLVGQDENGNNLKLYDARTDGGFPFVPPPPECAAADECHGPGSSRPQVPVDGTGAVLGSGGNASPPVGQAKHHHVKKRHRKSHKKSSKGRRLRPTHGRR